AIAEAAYQQEQAARRREEARRLRETHGAAPNRSRVPWGDLDRPSVPDQGTRGGTVTLNPGLRAVELCRRAAVAHAYAKEVQMQARRVCGTVRVMHKDRHADPLPDADLPSLDL